MWKMGGIIIFVKFSWKKEAYIFYYKIDSSINKRFSWSHLLLQVHTKYCLGLSANLLPVLELLIVKHFWRKSICRHSSNSGCNASSVIFVHYEVLEGSRKKLGFTILSLLVLIFLPLFTTGFFYLFQIYKSALLAPIFYYLVSLLKNLFVGANLKCHFTSPFRVEWIHS